LSIEKLDNTVEQWILRVNCAAKWFPEAELAIDRRREKSLMIEEICRGAFSYKEIKDRPYGRQ